MISTKQMRKITFILVGLVCLPLPVFAAGASSKMEAISAKASEIAGEATDLAGKATTKASILADEATAKAMTFAGKASTLAGKASAKTSDLANKLININTADTSTLAKIPGIGEKLAEAITKHRDTNGLFTQAKDLLNVDGISDSLLKKIEPFLQF